jgi:acetyl esterase/lipase
MTRQELDPEIAAAVAAFGLPTVDFDTLSLWRELSLSSPLSGAVVRTEYSVPGDPSVVLRVHRAGDAEGSLPCIYSMHPGGYVSGGYAMDDRTFDVWCPTLGIVGVSVEYRLAPETPYPGPLEDCYQGLKWVYEQSDELGVDVRKLGVAGISAGGGLAAALALLARDRGEVPLAFQLLDSPMLDDRQQTPSSQLDGLKVWPREATRFSWSCYLGDLYGTDVVPYTAAPSRCADLSGLPRALVAVGTLDGFRDEAIDYVQRLNQAGVPCDLRLYGGACHGYQIAADSTLVHQISRDITEWLKRCLAQLAASPTADRPAATAREL